MPYIVLVASLPDDAIQTIKDKVNFPTKPDEVLHGVSNIIAALNGGEKRSDNCYVVVRTTDPAVSTAGTGSVSIDCDKP